ncbi:fimbria/pilus periplasmic chaperone [Luteibacter flocculans]|uniref:Fimbria/pilus periplasmic chaperone n=1 Tax=Luteibacter flocculans TaxID=2780091 RepID=A0ABY4T3I4_9GAMM|nr:fimbria/pilus periplasmic chaperone [Luteibacter flocculans]URL58462.1 fimbria/pilus periplasmic chaperone [Luteibacter flocculans]
MPGISLTARRLGCAAAVVAYATGGTTHASVVMNSTRYVYAADAKEITVKVSNVGKLPALMQAWIDDGNNASTPEHIDVPFNLTPPISRLEAGKSQTLRVSYTGGVLPNDRESQFWINVLEVPPKPQDSGDTSKMQLAFRYRLKLFYRPKGLAGSADLAPEKLVWRRGADGVLGVDNPTPFYVTLNEARVSVAGDDIEIEPFAIAPNAHVDVKPAKPVPTADRVEVHYRSINDYGGFVPHTKAIKSP